MLDGSLTQSNTTRASSAWNKKKTCHQIGQANRLRTLVGLESLSATITHQKCNTENKIQKVSEAWEIQKGMAFGGFATMYCQSSRKFAPFCDLLLKQNTPLVGAGSKSDHSKPPSPLNVQQRHWGQQQLKHVEATCVHQSSPQFRTWRPAFVASRWPLSGCCMPVHASGQARFALSKQAYCVLRTCQMPTNRTRRLKHYTVTSRRLQAIHGYTVKRLLRFDAGNCCNWNTWDSMRCWVSRICCSCRGDFGLSVFQTVYPFNMECMKPWKGRPTDGILTYDHVHQAEACVRHNCSYCCHDRTHICHVHATEYIHMHMYMHMHVYMHLYM